MASPGQKRGSCGHVMALFDSHLKCARCRDKGIGDDLCVKKKQCQICDNLSEQQKLQLATPTYRVRKELQKKSSSPSHSVDPADVTVIQKVESKGDVSDRGETPSKKAKKSSHKSPTKKKPSKTPVDFQSDLKGVDDKWSERFARLEALFLAKNFQVPVEPVKSTEVVVSDRPFIPPSDQSTSVSGEKQPPGAASKKNVVTATQPVEVPGAMLATQPVEAPGAAHVLLTEQTSNLPAAVHRPEVQPPGPAAQPVTSLSQQSSSLTGTTVPPEEPEILTDHLSDRPSSLADEGELSDLGSTGQEHEDLSEVDQELTAEQNYRETLRGVRSFMAWNDIPEFDSASGSQDDNPFTGSKVSHTGKVSVKVPVDEWLCRKMEKLNITVQEGYPSRTSENAGLSRDQFVKPPKTLRWYNMHSEKKDFSRSKVYHWTNEPARLNSTFSRIANRSLPSAPASRPVSQDMLRKWERAAHDQSYMCNQAAAFSRCLTKVQDNMVSQLKLIQSVTSKGKSASKITQAADELDFLVTFNCSITQAMARTMQDLSEGVFVNMTNLTLARRDSYLDFLKTGIKPDTLTSLRTAPLHLSALFPDHIISKAEEEIRHFEDKRTAGPSHRKPQRFHPYSQPQRQQQDTDRKQGLPAWKQLGNRRRGQRSHRGRGASSFVPRPAKTQKQYK